MMKKNYETDGGAQARAFPIETQALWGPVVQQYTAGKIVKKDCTGRGLLGLSGEIGPGGPLYNRGVPAYRPEYIPSPQLP
jgi:hypothetical protein